jgi:hypothetical protein
MRANEREDRDITNLRVQERTRRALKALARERGQTMMGCLWELVRDAQQRQEREASHG